MNKKQLEQEQAQHDYDEVLTRFFSASDPSEMERLIPELATALQRIPADSLREKIRKARDVSSAVKHMTLAGQKPAILHALTKGNVELFFRDIEILPELFADTELMENTLVVWMLNRLSKNDRGDAAREHLKRLAKILTNTHGAPAYETKEERDAANSENRSAATKRYRKTIRKKRTGKSMS